MTSLSTLKKMMNDIEDTEEYMNISKYINLVENSRYFLILLVIMFLATTLTLW